MPHKRKPVKLGDKRCLYGLILACGVLLISMDRMIYPVGIMVEPLVEMRLEREYTKLSPEIVSLIKQKVFCNLNISRYTIISAYRLFCRIIYLAKDDPGKLQKLLTTDKLCELRDNIEYSPNTGDICLTPKMLDILVQDQNAVDVLALFLMKQVDGHYRGDSNGASPRPWLCLTRDMIGVLALRKNSHEQKHARRIAAMVRRCKDVALEEDAKYMVLTGHDYNQECLVGARFRHFNAIASGYSKPDDSKMNRMIMRRFDRIEHLLTSKHGCCSKGKNCCAYSVNNV